jgi:hypothetical protein
MVVSNVSFHNENNEYKVNQLGNKKNVNNGTAKKME